MSEERAALSGNNKFYSIIVRKIIPTKLSKIGADPFGLRYDLE